VFDMREVSTTQGKPVNPVHAVEWARQCPSLEQVAIDAPVPAPSSPAEGSRLVDPRRTSCPHLFTAVSALNRFWAHFPCGRERRSMSAWRSLSDRSGVSLHARTIAGRQGRSCSTARVTGRRHYSCVVPAPLPCATNVRSKFFALYNQPQERLRLMGNFNYGAVVRLRRGVNRRARAR